MSSAPLLIAHHIVKRFGDRRVLNEFSLDVHQGEVVCLIGPSGSGKSTFLRCVNHLEPFDAGDLIVDGVRIGYRNAKGSLRELSFNQIAAQRRAVGMVFQSFNLFSHMHVLDNLTIAPIKVLGIDPEDARQQAHEILGRTGLSGREMAYPGQLSGGEQQRVAIARALITRPAIILADEPTGNLDTRNSEAVLEMLRFSNREFNQTVLMITHNEEAASIGDRILHMRDGEMTGVGVGAELVGRV
jgi:polar amino acid transport system ATP-binding protein